MDAIARWQTLALTVVVFGFLPGALLRAIVRAFPPSDQRRRELRAELYVVPRWERPFWVAQQIEVAIFEGLPARLRITYTAVLRRSITWVFRSQAIQEDLLRALDEIPLRHQAAWVFGESRDALSVKWHLQSGVALHQRNPDTFWIPDDEEKSGVRPGNIVKLMFWSSDGWGERMWVEVQRLRRNQYRGTLRNTPIGIPRLNWGSTVKFSKEHIIDIELSVAE